MWANRGTFYQRPSTARSQCSSPLAGPGPGHAKWQLAVILVGSSKDKWPKKKKKETKEAKGKKEETSDTQKWFPRPMAAQPRGGVGGEGGIALVSRRAAVSPVLWSPG